MAVAQGYGKTVTSGSVFAYDTGDSRNSYIGEPTTNLALFSVTSGITFNADYATLTSQVADYSVTYRGRPSLRCTSTGQWNIYKYPRSGNYTATSSTAFTFSWKMKWSDGRVPAFSNGYIYTDANSFYPAVTVTPLEDGWYLCQTTSSGTSSPVYLTGFTTTQYGTCYIVDWQVEAKTHATSFTPAGTSRSVTQGLLPLVGTSTLNLTNMSFDSNAQMTFDGTNDTISIPSTTSTNISGNITMEAVIKRDADVAQVVMHKELQYTLYIAADGSISYADSSYWSYAAFGFHGTSIISGLYHHIVVTKEGSLVTIYVNGNVVVSQNFGSAITQTSNTLYIGSYDGSLYFFGGEIPIAKIYNRALTVAEVKQNFNFYDARFGIEIEAIYYFAVSNRSTNLSQRYLDGSGNTVRIEAKNMASTTPAYILYQKPDANNTGPGDYTEVARDDIGTPARLTIFGPQTKYSNGRYFTTVNVHESKKGGRLFFNFPNGGTTQYGKAFYKTIVTPHVP